MNNKSEFFAILFSQSVLGGGGGYLSSRRVSGGLFRELFSGDIALASSVSLDFFIFPICKKFVLHFFLFYR